MKRTKSKFPTSPVLLGLLLGNTFIAAIFFVLSVSCYIYGDNSAGFGYAMNGTISVVINAIIFAVALVYNIIWGD